MKSGLATLASGWRELPANWACNALLFWLNAAVPGHPLAWGKILVGTNFSQRKLDFGGFRAFLKGFLGLVFFTLLFVSLSLLCSSFLSLCCVFVCFLWCGRIWIMWQMKSQHMPFGYLQRIAAAFLGPEIIIIMCQEEGEYWMKLDSLSGNILRAASSN